MRTVVAGVDQEQPSRQVLDRALAEAESTGRPLRVLHAWATPTWAPAAAALDDLAGDVGRDVRAQHDAARQLAAALHARSTALHDAESDTVPPDAVSPDAVHDAVPPEDRAVQASAQGRHGEAGDLLVRASAEAGLVVVGARSHGALLSAVLGSATGHVLRHAACAVMVVPPTSAPGPYRRVVVGYDDPVHAGSALRWGLDAAARHRCPLVVVHALPRTTSPAPRSVQLADAHHEDDVRARLRDRVARAARLHPDVPVTTSLRDGSPREVLLSEAGPEDLLVLGSRARDGVVEALLGAVAAQCVQEATGTVVVVRAGHERLDDPARPEDGAAAAVELARTGPR